MKFKQPDSNVEWTAWGRTDPLYAVATCPGREKNGEAPWSDESFYALGESDWQDFRRCWERYTLDHSSCVEIGCGAGRMTRHMAPDFGVLHALDVSEDMLRYARRNIDATNVTFHRTSGTDLPVFDSTITGVFSCHVFQHFDNLEIARHYFLESHRVLRDGGTLMVHLPIYRWPSGSRAYSLLHQWQSQVDDWKATLNRRLIRAGMFRPLMRVLAYPIDWIFRELPKMGLEQVEVMVIPLMRNGDPHPFVFARKPVRR